MFICLGENTEKYITFTAPIEKEVTRDDENGEEITKRTSYIFQFIDSAKFMASYLLNPGNDLSKGIHRTKCKYCDCFLEYANFKDDLLQQKCLCFNKNYQQKFDKNLKEQFFNTDKFSNYDNNKFIIPKRCLSS